MNLRQRAQGGGGLASGNYEALWDVALDGGHHVRMVASALGPPPPALVHRAHDAGAIVAALAGAPVHAERHVAVGVDVVVAQGTEAGGHTGEISTMVLVPQVVDAVSPTPVVAAGGIATGRQIAAAMALGAEGVWCGSAVVDHRGSRDRRGLEGEVPQGQLPRHAALPIQDRQAGSDDPQRLDGRVVQGRRARASRHASPEHAGIRSHRPNPPCRRRPPRQRRLRPSRALRRPGGRQCSTRSARPARWS